jgi:hypothetical protein
MAKVPRAAVKIPRKLHNPQTLQGIRDRLVPRRGYTPPPEYDPVKEIIEATEFFLAFRPKALHSPKDQERELERIQEAADGLAEAIDQADEGTMKRLGHDLGWQEEMETRLHRLSGRALVRLKEMPEHVTGRRRDTSLQDFLLQLMAIYQRATDREPGSVGHFNNLVRYVLESIDLDIWTEETLIRDRIRQAKKTNTTKPKAQSLIKSSS